MPDGRELGDSTIELDCALELLKEKERICRELGNKDGLQRSLGNQALIHRDRGELDLAVELHKEEERICRELGNKDGLQRSLGNQALIHRDRGELAAVRHRAETLNRDLENSRAELESVRHQLNGEIEHRTSLEIRCDELIRDYEQTSKALSDHTIDLEQLKSALAAEKLRTASAEQENLRHADELVLEGIGISLYDTKENLRLADELTAEHTRRIDVEHQLDVFRQEMLKRETALVAENENIQGYCDSLQQKFDAFIESFDTERQKITSLLKEAETAVEEEKHQRLCAEKTLKETVNARDEELRTLHLAYAELRKEMDTKEAELVIAVRELETAKGTWENLEKELAAAVLGRAQSENLAQSISHERDQLKEELGNEQRLRCSAEEGLSQVMQAKEKTEQKLRTVTKKKAHEKTRWLTKIQKLKDEIKTMHASQKSLESMMSTAERERAMKEAEVQELSGELGQAMAKLEAENEKWRATEEELMEIREEFLRKKPVATTTIAEEIPVEKHAIVVKEPDLPAGVDSGLQPVAVNESIHEGKSLLHNELLVLPYAEPEKIPVEEVRSVKDLSDEVQDLNIRGLPAAVPATVADAKSDMSAEGPSATGPGISSVAGGEEETRVVREGGDDRVMEHHGDKEWISQENGDKEWLQRSLGNQALIHRDRGELDRAMELLMEQERICRDLGNNDGLQRSLGNQALIHRDRGELDRAMELHKEKEQICRDLGNKKGIVISLANQAGIFMYERQDPAAAFPLLEEAYQIAVSSGFESLVKQLKVHLERVQKIDRLPRHQK